MIPIHDRKESNASHFPTSDPALSAGARRTRILTAALAILLSAFFAAAVHCESLQVKLATGAGHGALLKPDGAVWSWGDNRSGALGTDEELLAQSDVPMNVGEAAPDECSALFSCQTASGKYIQICGEQDESDPSRWSDIQYRFGPGAGPPGAGLPERSIQGRTAPLLLPRRAEGRIPRLGALLDRKL